jgi:hypothetical protein
MIDIQSYKEHGYILMRDFLDPEEVDRIRDEAKAVFIAQMRRLEIVPPGDLTEPEFEHGMFELFEADLAAFVNCGKQVQHLISLHRLSLDERITDVLKELGLDFANIATRPLLYFNSSRLAKKEVYWRLANHQDWRSTQGSLDSIVVWIPLIDIDTALGALEVLPGSHKDGLFQAEFEDGYGRIDDDFQAPFVPVEVKRGDALFFSTFLVHRSGTNVTDSIRWSCHFRYNNLLEPTFIERGVPHPYLYRPSETLMTEDFPSVEQVNDLFR